MDWTMLKQAESGWNLSETQKIQLTDRICNQERGSIRLWLPPVWKPVVGLAAVCAFAFALLLLWPKAPVEEQVVTLPGSTGEAQPDEFVPDDNSGTIENNEKEDNANEPITEKDPAKEEAPVQKEDTPADEGGEQENLAQEPEKVPLEEEPEPELITIPTLGERYDYDEFMVEPREEKVDEATAIEIARKFIQDEYDAEELAFYTGVKSRFHSSGTYDEGSYTITFYCPLGEGGYIEGPSLYVRMSARGGVKNSSASQGLTNFDLNLLKGLTKAELQRQVFAQLTDRYKENAFGITIETVTLREIEGRPILTVSTDAEIDAPHAHDGHKAIIYTYDFTAAAWGEPEECM